MKLIIESIKDGLATCRNQTKGEALCYLQCIEDKDFYSLKLKSGDVIEIPDCTFIAAPTYVPDADEIKIIKE